LPPIGELQGNKTITTKEIIVAGKLIRTEIIEEIELTGEEPPEGRREAGPHKLPGLKQG